MRQTEILELMKVARYYKFRGEPKNQNDRAIRDWGICYLKNINGHQLLSFVNSVSILFDKYKSDNIKQPELKTELTIAIKDIEQSAPKEETK